jgi:putative transposase
VARAVIRKGREVVGKNALGQRRGSECGERVPRVLDIYSRECVALVAGRGFSGKDVGWFLSKAGTERGALPEMISVDNGTEFTSKALDHWAYSNQVELNFSRPGRPGDNPHIEAFNSVVRRECLTQHWFVDLRDAQNELNRWRLDYNTVRPHGSLRRSTPAQVGAGAFYTPGPERGSSPRFLIQRDLQNGVLFGLT